MRELIESGDRSFSFEFFPPKDEAGEEQLWRAITELEPYRPTFVSVTYGAGGSSRDTTVRITGRIARGDLAGAGRPPDLCRPHPRRARRRSSTPTPRPASRTCWRCGATRRAVRAPSGPRPTAASPTPASSSARVGATSRVAVARGFPTGHSALEPRSSRTPARCKAKQDAGAEFAITDMVFRASDYFGLRRARPPPRASTIPILPGIMPILNLGSGQPDGRAVRARAARRGRRADRAGQRRPGRRARRGHRDGGRALRGAARRGCAGPALLHAQPLQGDARDLRAPCRSRSDRYGCAHEQRTVTVTGQGSTSVAPDTAVVRVAAVARAAGVAAAFACVARPPRRRSAWWPGGTPTRSGSRTTGINVWPWHDNQGQQRGFEARHSLAIGCPDLDAAGALLDELATSVGDALAVEGVALEVSDPTAARDQAVAAAYADAVRQAEQLAAPRRRLARRGAGHRSGRRPAAAARPSAAWTRWRCRRRSSRGRRRSARA